MTLQRINVTTSQPSIWSCRHQYHLQCIMQWAQRSRECPMCFRALQLQVCSSPAVPRGGCLQICSVLACWVSLQSMHQEANICMHHCFLPLLLTFNMLLAYFGVKQLCAWCVSAFCSVHKYCELCWSNCQSAGPHDARTAAFWGVHSTRALTASTAHVHGS